MKKIFFFVFLFPAALFAGWNNNYSLFGNGGEGTQSANAALQILSYLLIVFGVFLFLHSSYKILGSNDPQDKTRGAFFTNVFLLILSMLFIANKWVILKTLGVN